MADKVTTTIILGLELAFTEDEEEKITTIKLPNPKSNLNESLVRAGTEELINNILRTEDQITSTSASFTLQSAYRETEEKIELDIDWKE